MSFFGALFGGSNPTLNATIGKTGQISDFASSLGQSNTTQGSNFFSSLLSGDSSKIAQTLAPEISAAKVSNQNTQKTNATMGNRSGGTAATNAAASDRLHSDITNLTGSLTGGAASTLLSSGQSLLGTALGGYNQQAQMSQEQMQNWMNSILGKGITGAAAYGESAGLGAIGGGGAGGGASGFVGGITGGEGNS
jgi:hypothetical protein